jgi:hypothetical protein
LSEFGYNTNSDKNQSFVRKRNEQKMNSNERVLVIECDECGQKSEYTIMDSLDSEVNVYDKQRLLSGTLFECKCGNCGVVRDLAYDMIYRDVEHNALIYMVNGETSQGVYTALRLTDSLPNRDDGGVNNLRKRIVTCPHQLQEKALIFDQNLDDRVIELAKIFCIGDAEENLPDFYPVGAEFNVKDGKPVIELIGEEKIVTAVIPDGLYQHLEHKFADVLERNDEYVINDLWAMDVLGIDPYEDEIDCDGDCDHCHHNCDDEWGEEDDSRDDEDR